MDQNRNLPHYSATDWDSFFADNDVVVPYLDVCVFAVKKLRNHPKATLYEFGCGMGNNVRLIRGLFPAARILGSDISEVAIKRLQGMPNAEFWVNEEDLKLSGKVLDVVIERGAIQHVPKALARDYVDQIYSAMCSGAEGYFEIASTAHEKFFELGESGHDKGFGFRTFYTIDDIGRLFERFRIKKVYHLTRELIGEQPKSVQGSFQVEVEKG